MQDTKLERNPHQAIGPLQK